jgi:hypothetical protein
MSSRSVRPTQPSCPSPTRQARRSVAAIPRSEAWNDAGKSCAALVRRRAGARGYSQPSRIAGSKGASVARLYS